MSDKELQKPVKRLLVNVWKSLVHLLFIYFFYFFRPKNGSLVKGCPAEETDSWVITASLAGENNQCDYLQFSGKHAIIFNRCIILMFGLEVICYQHTDIHFLFTSKNCKKKKKKGYLCLQFKLSSSIYWLSHVQAQDNTFIAGNVSQSMTDWSHFKKSKLHHMHF